MTELWKELHNRALKTESNDRVYLRQFARRIPRYTTGCKCREFWNQWIKKNPPVYGEKYFEWTVKAHNAVNRKLNKPVYTVEEARAFYSSD